MARSTWTNDTVLSAIQDQYRRGRLAKVRSEDCGLYLAAAKRFGTWHKALIAAGITVDSTVGPNRIDVTAANIFGFAVSVSSSLTPGSGRAVAPN